MMKSQEQLRDYAEAQMRGMQNMYPNMLGGSIAQAGISAPPTRPLSPVECEMQGLSEILGTLHKRVSVLEERLRPILHGQVDKPSPAEMPMPSSTTGVPMADHIRSLYDTACVLRNRLDDITERLAL